MRVRVFIPYGITVQVVSPATSPSSGRDRRVCGVKPADDRGIAMQTASDLMVIESFLLADTFRCFDNSQNGELLNR